MSGLQIDIIEQPNLIKNYWLKEKKVVFLIIFFGIIFNASMVLGPILQGRLIDSILNESPVNKVLIQIGVFIGTILFIQVTRFFKRFYVRRFANSTSATMRLIIYNNIMNKNISELDDENIGNLMTRVISDVELCVEGMRKVTTEVFDTGVLMTAYLISMMFYDIKITILSCIFIPVAMKLAEVLKSVIYKYSIAYRKKSSEVADLIYDSIEHTVLFRVNGIEGKNREEYFSALEDLQSKAIKASILENSMQPIYNIIALMGIIIVIYLGGSKVIDGSLSVGDFSAYMLMFTATATKASKAAKLFNSAQKSKISWIRIKPYLGEYIKKDEIVNTSVEKININVDNLSFSYPSNEELIIDGINFSARPGEIIGVTGPIASGKSTLGLALLGLYPYKGSIKIQGKELSEYTSSERSSMISYLSHDSELLSDTIYNNIALGKDMDIKEVIRDICFDKDLASMEKKENTLVGNRGIRLSGGQQARMALGRALINKNKIIILDEPFSAIDIKTEEQIIRNLRENYKESIIIIISHRLNIFKDVNQVIMFNDDKIMEYGTHEELMKTSDRYSTIWTLQRGEDYEK
ncbi:MAG: ABC transporter ATP-binding protein [Clostridium sp.]|uniref:ABC transporter ATP-binding protein n=1 Tax=Clostridium sp. TaxID=1506 RepID=UPI0030552DCA